MWKSRCNPASLKRILLQTTNWNIFTLHLKYFVFRWDCLGSLIFSLKMTVFFGRGIPFEVSSLISSIVCRLFFFLRCQLSRCIFAYSYKVVAWGVNQQTIFFFLIFDGFFSILNCCFVIRTAFRICLLFEAIFLESRTLCSTKSWVREDAMDVSSFRKWIARLLKYLRS